MQIFLYNFFFCDIGSAYQHVVAAILDKIFFFFCGNESTRKILFEMGL